MIFKFIALPEYIMKCQNACLVLQVSTYNPIIASIRETNLSEENYTTLMGR